MMPPKTVEVRFVKTNNVVIHVAAAPSANTAVSADVTVKVIGNAEKAMTIGSASVDIRSLNRSLRDLPAPTPELTSASEKSLTV